MDSGGYTAVQPSHVQHCKAYELWVIATRQQRFLLGHKGTLWGGMLTTGVALCVKAGRMGNLCVLA